MLNTDLTIICQGKLTKEALDFYIKHYTNYRVIISTWIDNKIDISNISDNITVVKYGRPEDPGHQNIYLQIWSTLHGLSCVNTKYCIKMRADEYVSCIEYIHQKIITDNSKLYTLPIFFRAWNHIPYHISDHLIAGTTDNLRLMFRTALDRKKDHPMAEVIFTRGYLEKKIPNLYSQYEDKNIMKKYFDILDLNMVKPYLLIANCYRMRFANNFIPSHHGSISNINNI